MWAILALTNNQCFIGIPVNGLVIGCLTNWWLTIQHKLLFIYENHGVISETHFP